MLPLNLRDEELRLRPLVPKISLIGELALTKPYIEELEELLAQFLRRWDLRQRQEWQQATDTLIKQYRHCWAVYLVGKGIFSYRQRQYWPHVAEGLGFAETGFSSYWGHYFLRYLSTYRLLHPKLPEALRYITPILMHGGIPLSCLGDYFGHLIYPSLKRPDHGLAPTNDLIALWLAECDREETLYSQIDKPIPRFLKYGGEVAEDFVERSLELVRQHALTRAVPTAEDVGLPAHIVEEYARWASRPDRPALPSAAHGIQRPIVLVDPYDGPMLELPEQRLPDTGRPARPVWRIQVDGQTWERHARMFSRRGAWETELDRIPLPAPGSQYRIAFSDGRGLSHQWEITGLSAATPVLAFLETTWRLLEWRGVLQGRQLWLLYPIDSNQPLRVANGERLTSIGRLPGAWSRYQLELWDLERATEVSLGSSRIAVQREAASLRPCLTGGERLWLSHGANQAPVYVGAPPYLHLPIAGPDDPAADPGRWNVTIQDEAGVTLRRRNLAHLAAETRRETSGLSVPLASSLLLGPTPCGAYEVRLRGPLGRDATLALAVLPYLRITGHEKVRLPEVDGHVPPARLRAETIESFNLSSPDAEVTVERLAAGAHRIVVPGGRLRVNLRFHATTAAFAPFHLTLPLPALRWSLLEGDAPVGADGWQTAPLLQSSTWLDTAENPRLVVAVAAGQVDAPPLTVRLVVHGPDGHPVQEIEARGTSSSESIFFLTAARDTVRAVGSDGCEIRLVLDDLPGHQSSVDLPVIMLGRPPIVVPPPGPNPVPATPTMTRLWSLWRPWEAPHVHMEIIDEDDGEDLEAMASLLPPGRYRMEHASTTAPALTPARPWPDGLTTRDIVLGSPSTCLAYLEGRPDDMPGWIERLLASLDGYPTRRHPSPFAGVFDRRCLNMCLDALLVIAEQPNNATIFVDTPRPDLRGFCDVLLDRRLDLLAVATELQASLGDRERVALHRLLLALGVLDVGLTDHNGAQPLSSARLAALWSLWPTIAVAVESPSIVCGDQVAPADGDTVLGTLIDDLPVGLQRWLAQPTVAAAFGSPLGDDMLEASTEAIAGELARLQTVARDNEAHFRWRVLTLAWLLSIKEDPKRWHGALAWQQKHLVDTQGALTRLRRAVPVVRPAIDLLMRRHASRWTEKPGNVPFMIGATALTLRCLAHIPEARLALATNGRVWRQRALRAFDLAPEIFAHDLCLMELMVAIGHAEREDRG